LPLQRLHSFCRNAEVPRKEILKNVHEYGYGDSV